MKIPFSNYQPNANAASRTASVTNQAAIFKSGDINPSLWFDPAHPEQPTDLGARVLQSVGLGLKYKVSSTLDVNSNIKVIPMDQKALRCTPLLNDAKDTVIEQQIRTPLSAQDLSLLTSQTTEFPDLVGVEFIYSLTSESLIKKFHDKMRAHVEAGKIIAEFTPGTALAPGEIGPQAAYKVEPTESSFQELELWLKGLNTIYYAFTAEMRREDCLLFDLAKSDELTVYAEAKFQRRDGTLSLYRVNAALIFKLLHLVEPDDVNARDVQRSTLAEIAPHADLWVASQVKSASDYDNIAIVSGGSKPATIVLPTNVIAGPVPQSLFTYITSDSIQIFATALRQGHDLYITYLGPAFRIGDLEKIGLEKKSFKTDTADPISATYVENQLKDKMNFPQNLVFYQSAEKIFFYPEDDTGSFKERVEGTGPARSVVPQSIEKARPIHLPYQTAPKVYRANRSKQPRRLFPLAYRFEISIDPEHTLLCDLTQDRIDCCRQEYVFHMNWKRENNRYYYQNPNADDIDPANNHVQIIPTNAQGAPDETRANEALPAFKGSPNRPIPRRSDFRALTDQEKNEKNVVQDSVSMYAPLTLVDYKVVHNHLPALRQKVADLLPTVDRLINQAGPINPNGTDLRPLLQKTLALLRDTIPGDTSNDPMTTLGFQKYITGIILRETPVNLFKKRMHELGDAIGLPNHLNDILKISSSWRPPEQNETVSVTIKSNHQEGTASDVQPSGAGKQLRNPLFMAVLHDVGQEINSRRQLKELFLEDGAENFNTGQFELALLDQEITYNPTTKKFVTRSSGGTATPLSSDKSKVCTYMKRDFDGVLIRIKLLDAITAINPFVSGLLTPSPISIEFAQFPGLIATLAGATPSLCDAREKVLYISNRTVGITGIKEEVTGLANSIRAGCQTATPFIAQALLTITRLVSSVHDVYTDAKQQYEDPVNSRFAFELHEIYQFAETANSAAVTIYENVTGINDRLTKVSDLCDKLVELLNKPKVDVNLATKTISDINDRYSDLFESLHLSFLQTFISIKSYSAALARRTSETQRPEATAYAESLKVQCENMEARFTPPSWFSPPPTFLHLYAYALYYASHVHFTYKETAVL